MTLLDFPRYLSAKKSVDDRSLNRWVYGQLQMALAARQATAPLRLLEIGCGIGTMVERLWDWGLASRVEYLALDREPDLIAAAQLRLGEFAARRQIVSPPQESGLSLQQGGRDWRVQLQVGDILAFAEGPACNLGFDLIVAHAVLDLLDLEESLPRLLGLLRPGGLYYFTLNFDGVTIFQPDVDPEFEALLLHCYHGSMNGPQEGRGGHSQTGRRLLQGLCGSGSEVLAAGSSDWLVWPTPAHTYPADEAFFLSSILDFLADALASVPDLDETRLQSWLAHRRAQIAVGELIFLAHQVDVCGRR